MALFRRKKDEPVLPEVDKYYEGERRDRPVMAWLLALASIAVVALIIVGLFLGGRWAYNKIAKNDDEVATTSDTDAPTFDGAPQNTNQNPSDNSAPQPSTSEPQGTNSEQNSTSTGSTSSQSTNQPSNSTPAASTPSSTSPLPNTGPEGIAVAFVVTSVVAGGSHYLIQRHKARA